MRYTSTSFSLPVCSKPMTELEYDLRVGNINQSEYDQAQANAEQGGKDGRVTG